MWIEAGSAWGCIIYSCVPARCRTLRSCLVVHRIWWLPMRRTSTKEAPPSSPPLISHHGNRSNHRTETKNNNVQVSYNTIVKFADKDLSYPISSNFKLLALNFVRITNMTRIFILQWSFKGNLWILDEQKWTALTHLLPFWDTFWCKNFYINCRIHSRSHCPGQYR